MQVRFELDWSQGRPRYHMPRACLMRNGSQWVCASNRDYYGFVDGGGMAWSQIGFAYAGDSEYIEDAARTTLLDTGRTVYAQWIVFTAREESEHV